MCFLASANRDERRFVDPDRFDLHRPEADPDRAFTGQAAHLAFGGGRHFCLGAVLSRFEIEVALGRILDALPDLRLAGDVPPRRRRLVSARPGDAARSFLAPLTTLEGTSQ